MKYKRFNKKPDKEAIEQARLELEKRNQAIKDLLKRLDEAGNCPPSKLTLSFQVSTK